MAGLVPIPNTRIPGLLARQRLVGQFQADTLDLFRLQDQISTGQRIILPSDDAPAALRAISLQRLIERKGQLETNINTGQSFLAATDTALNDVSRLLSDIRGSTLGVAGTTSSQQERDAVINQVNEAIEALIDTGNRNFRGRFLFAGSQTNVKPYSFDGDSVSYAGNDRLVQSFSDIGVLLSSNAPGTDVFGGISNVVRGTADLNPQLTSGTLLTSLRGGRGLNSDGALTISDGTNASVVDISTAATIGDVARLIEANPPAGRAISVSITGQGLTLQLTDGSPGNLTVKEVANGTAARELGILEDFGVLTNPLVGSDLDPVVLKTTRIDDLVGTKARALINSAGSDNDISLEAVANGTAFDGVAIQFVNDAQLQAASGITAGNEFAQFDANARSARAALTFQGGGNDLVLTATGSPETDFNNVTIRVVSGGAIGDAASVSYDGTTKVLTVAVDNTGATTVQTVINEIGTEGTFTAAHDNSVEAALNPAAFIEVADVGSLNGNTGNSGGVAKTLYVNVQAGSSTANGVIAAINAEGTFTAKLDAQDTTQQANAGTGAVSLVPTGAPLTTSGGSGGSLDKDSGIRIVNGGETFDITFENAETVEDILNTLIASGAGIVASINEDGTGIDIHSRLSGSEFQIGELGGQTATQLGIRSYTGETKLAGLNNGIGVPTKEGFELPTIAGTDLTISASDGQSFTVDLSSAETLADVVATINTATGGVVTAQLAAPGNVLELVDSTFPNVGQLAVTQESGSSAAQFLGLVPDGATAGSSTTDTLTGSPERYIDFTITSASGQTFGVDLSSATTVGDAIDAINAITTTNITAQLATNGNGIELVDNTVGGGDLTVTAAESSRAAEFLGLIPIGSTENSSATSSLTGEDRNFQETASAFTTLIQLRDALQSGDIPSIERAIAKIDGDIDRVNFARAEVGARGRGLDIAQQNLEEEDIQLRSALSEEIDVDLVEAISALTARQVSLEASLRATANILQLSLLNFL